MHDKSFVPSTLNILFAVAACSRRWETATIETLMAQFSLLQSLKHELPLLRSLRIEVRRPSPQNEFAWAESFNGYLVAFARAPSLNRVSSRDRRVPRTSFAFPWSHITHLQVDTSGGILLRDFIPMLRMAQNLEECVLDQREEFLH